MPPPRSPSYWPWVKQPSVTLVLELPLLEAIDWQPIDAWIHNAWAAPAIDELPTQADIAPDHPVVQLARRALTVAGVLLRAIGWPVFEAGFVRSLNAHPSRPDHHHITLQVPCMDQLPRQLFDNCYRQAVRVVLRALPDSVGDSERTAWVEQLYEQFVERYKRAVPTGKSTLPLLKGAHSLKLPFTHLGSGLYQLGWGARGHVLDRSSVLADSAIGAKLSHDKWACTAWLSQFGLPTPLNLRVKTWPQTLEAARTLGYPVVLKPQDRDRGEGVSIDIHNEEQLKTAFDTAHAISPNLMVEQQVAGTCYRVLVAGSQVAGVIRRNPKSVKGDGKLTVLQLIEQANATNAAKPKHQQSSPLPIDELAIDSLEQADLTLDTVVEEGRLAPLRPLETGVWGGSPEVVTDVIHPANIEMAVRTARVLGLQVLGLDLVSSDISVPWHQNGAKIIECNYAPQVVGFSEKAQTIVQTLLQAVSPQIGRIPVHVFVGDTAAWEAALHWQRQCAASGTPACVTSHLATQGPNGPMELALTSHSLNKRTQALLLDTQTQALALVVQTDECLQRGLAVDTIDSLTILNHRLQPVEPIEAAGQDQRLPASSSQAVIRLLQGFVRP